jgi:hypothetical protein
VGSATCRAANTSRLGAEAAPAAHQGPYQMMRVIFHQLIMSLFIAQGILLPVIELLPMR